jgi:hypothetical protein
MSSEFNTSVETSGGTQAAVVPGTVRVDEVAEQSIIPANLRALEAVYFAAMMEEARVYDVMQQLVAMFARGSLPLGPGRAGAALYRSWKGNHHRLTAAQRHNVFARAFGWPGGDVDVKSNQKFNDLWLRFVSIVGMYSAELQMLPPGERTVGPEEVLVSGRLLAINLTTYGQGLAWFAVQDLKPEIQQMIEVLSDPEIQAAFDAKSPWQVVTKVAASELGAKPNVARGHTRGESGVIIIRWLANRRSRLLRPRSANILRHEDICEGRTAASQNKKATVYPTDSDLVTACEQWLAVTGTQEAEIKGQEVQEEPTSTEPFPVQQDNQHEQAA